MKLRSNRAIAVCLTLSLFYATATAASALHPQADSTAATTSTHLMPSAWSVGLATTFWNRASAPTDTPWLLPGALLGGEAIPSGRGVLLDNAQVSASWRLPDGFNAALSIAAHSNQDLGSASADLHDATLGWQSANGRSQIELGKRQGLFNPDNHSHAEQRLFSQLPLTQTVFLGGQYVDGGLHLSQQWRNWQLGYELWNGDHFPAGGTDDQFAHDVYLHFRSAAAHAEHRWSWSGGIWAMTTEVNQREDTRYSSDGHSHGTLSSNVTLAEYYFSGGTDLAGLFAAVAWQPDAATRVTLNASAMIAEPEGVLADSTRQVELDSRYEGGYLQLALQRQQHTLGVQVERLSLSNTLTGAAASALESAAGLSGNDDNPQRYSLVYRYQLSNQLALRAEWLQDKGQPDANQRFGVGILWHTINRNSVNNHDRSGSSHSHE